MEEENTMQTVRLGKTEIVTNKNAFGALPIQRVSDEEAVKLLRKAYDTFSKADWSTTSHPAYSPTPLLSRCCRILLSV